jgi:hypothetical protein
MIMLPCPRRRENPPGYGDPDLDTFEKRGNEDFTKCSYCGSIHPEAFMAALRQGFEVTPTDKNYKAYVDLPGYPDQKFYFQHMSEDHRTELIVLLNARAVKFAFPGRFYVLPFFVGRGP